MPRYDRKPSGRLQAGRPTNNQENGCWVNWGGRGGTGRGWRKASPRRPPGAGPRACGLRTAHRRLRAEKRAAEWEEGKVWHPKPRAPLPLNAPSSRARPGLGTGSSEHQARWGLGPPNLGNSTQAQRPAREPAAGPQSAAGKGTGGQALGASAQAGGSAGGGRVERAAGLCVTEPGEGASWSRGCHFS